MTCYNSSTLIGGNFILKNPLQDLLSSLNAVISTNESTRSGHVIYNPTYTYKFQLKTILVMQLLVIEQLSEHGSISAENSTIQPTLLHT